MFAQSLNLRPILDALRVMGVGAVVLAISLVMWAAEGAVAAAVVAVLLSVLGGYFAQRMAHFSSLGVHAVFCAATVGALLLQLESLSDSRALRNLASYQPPSGEVTASRPPPSATSVTSQVEVGTGAPLGDSAPFAASKTTPRGTSHDRGTSSLPTKRAAIPVSSAIPEASAPEPAATTAEFGYLTFDTSPWSIVSVGGKMLGQTPLIEVKLPAGPQVLTLKNPELGIVTTYSVTIEPGKTSARRIGIE